MGILGKHCRHRSDHNIHKHKSQLAKMKFEFLSVLFVNRKAIIFEGSISVDYDQIVKDQMYVLCEKCVAFEMKKNITRPSPHLNFDSSNNLEWATLLVKKKELKRPFSLTPVKQQFKKASCLLFGTAFSIARF